MSVSFTILPKRGLVYVQYTGTALIEATARKFAEYAQHPEFRTDQMQLVDLEHVTGFERDFPRILDLQMRKADVLMKSQAPVLMVYFAPSPTGLALAQTICRSWDGLPSIAARVVNTTQADALALLGQPETSFAELLDGAQHPARTVHPDR